MKNVMKLLLILLVSSNSFGQTDTLNKKVIHLTERQSAAAIDDLIVGDAAILENKNLKKINLAQKEELVTRSLKINDLNANITDYKMIIEQNEKVIDEQDKAIENINQSLRQQKDKTLFYKITTGAALLAAGYFALTN